MKQCRQTLLNRLCSVSHGGGEKKFQKNCKAFLINLRGVFNNLGISIIYGILHIQDLMMTSVMQVIISYLIKVLRPGNYQNVLIQSINTIFFFPQSICSLQECDSIFQGMYHTLLWKYCFLDHNKTTLVNLIKLATPQLSTLTDRGVQNNPEKALLIKSCSLSALELDKMSCTKY